MDSVQEVSRNDGKPDIQKARAETLVGVIRKCQERYKLDERQIGGEGDNLRFLRYYLSNGAVRFEESDRISYEDCLEQRLRVSNKESLDAGFPFNVLVHALRAYLEKRKQRPDEKIIAQVYRNVREIIFKCPRGDIFQTPNYQQFVGPIDRYMQENTDGKP